MQKTIAIGLTARFVRLFGPRVENILYVLNINKNTKRARITNDITFYGFLGSRNPMR